MTAFEKRLSDLANEALAVNREVSQGASAALVGKTVVGVEIEVWSSAGETGFRLELSDGSIFECPGVGYFGGPVAELVRMAGGIPTYEEQPDA